MSNSNKPTPVNTVSKSKDGTNIPYYYDRVVFENNITPINDVNLNKSQEALDFLLGQKSSSTDGKIHQMIDAINSEMLARSDDVTNLYELNAKLAKDIEDEIERAQDAENTKSDIGHNHDVWDLTSSTTVASKNDLSTEINTLKSSLNATITDLNNSLSEDIAGINTNLVNNYVNNSALESKGYATKNYVDGDFTNTVETMIKDAIEDAQFEDVDLSDYATKEDALLISDTVIFRCGDASTNMFTE